MNLMPSAQAIAEIRAHRLASRRVLGVDGFLIVATGYEARLDLILDLSSSPHTIDQAAAEAERFVSEHADDKTVFEVVVE